MKKALSYSFYKPNFIFPEIQIPANYTATFPAIWG